MYRNFRGIIGYFSRKRQECEINEWPVEDVFKKGTTIKLPGAAATSRDSQISECNFYTYCVQLADNNKAYVVAGVLHCSFQLVERSKGLVRGNIRLVSPLDADIYHQDPKLGLACMTFYDTSDAETIHNKWMQAFNPPAPPPPIENPYLLAVAKLLEEYK